MSNRYLEKIRKCNNYTEKNKYPLFIDGKRVGQINKYNVKYLLNTGAFEEKKGIITIKREFDTLEKRDEAFNKLIKYLEGKNIIKKEGIIYPITTNSFKEPLALIDKSLLTLLGIISYSQQLIGYINSEKGLEVWIYDDNGQFANIVEGSLSWNMAFDENLIKLCRDKALINRSLSEKSVNFSSISYCQEDDIGGQKKIVYCYELNLPENFKLEDKNGNSEKFILKSIDEIVTIIKDTNKFKQGSNLVMIEFLIKHGLISGSDKYYFDIKNSLNSNSIKYG